MKNTYTPFILILMCLASCSPRHYHGCGFIENPEFGRFGASSEHAGGHYAVRSYVRSEMKFRTEYIYENFDITFPDTFVTGKDYSVTDPGVSLWYAKGGQAGQMETSKAKGRFTIKEAGYDRVTLDLTVTFHSFKVSGGHLAEVPETIVRSGILRARKGYRLY